MMIDSPPSLAELEPVVALAHRAGDAILRVYAQGEDAAAVEWKDDRSPLTEADRAAHRLIVAGLRDLTPDVPVVSEEGEIPPVEELRDRPFWLVDPLDGTKEFLKRTGEFTVNIALVWERRPVAGVVHAPALGRSWMAGGDRAAVRTVGQEDPTTPLRVRKADPDRLGIVTSRDHVGPRVRELLDRTPSSQALSMGSSLKFCLIAEGKADLYLRDGPTMEWDTAAGQAVLERAGGTVVSPNGKTLAYSKPSLRNPPFLALGDEAVDWEPWMDGL